MGIKMIDVQSLKRNCMAAFEAEALKLQKKYVVTASKSYTDANMVPGLFTSSISPDRWVHTFSAKVEDKNAYYLRFVEWGTGEGAKQWPFPPYEQLIGNPARKYERPGKMIVPRGKGSKWTDLRGNSHPGADLMVWERGGKKHTAMQTRGQKPQQKLRNQTIWFLNPNTIGWVARHTLKKAMAATGRITI